MGGGDRHGLRGPDGRRAESDLRGEEDEPESGERSEGGDAAQLPEREGRRDDEGDDDPGERPVGEVGENAARGPVGPGRHDLAEGEGPVGNGEPGARVPDDGAEEDLHVARPGGQEREAVSPRERGGVRGGARRLLGEAAPGARRAERDRRGEGEDDLGEPRVRGRDGGRKEEEDGDPSEDRLPEDRAEGGEAEAERRPVGPAEAEDEDLQADHRRDGGGDEPVAVLVEDSAHHRRHQLAVGERPVGDGEPGAGRGHESPRDEQEEDRDGDGARCDADERAGFHRSFVLGSHADGAAGEVNVRSWTVVSPSATVRVNVCAGSFSCHASTV